MRIITTWMYFETSQVVGERSSRRRRGRGEEVEPGVGIAWCAGDTAAMMSISNLKVFRELPAGHGEVSHEVLSGYIDAFLIDEDEYEFVRSPPERPILNRSIVDYVIKEPFVVERSPPVHISLKGVLTNTNLPVWIGTYMGWSVAPEHSVLLFITVPGGIIIVTSATGLANALASGLSTSIKQLFHKK